ncbi:hypothetical protein THASP1DRAFT_31428 [Thamnocephalis sphaerospora]|uniref:Rrn7/TAF1B C-terminal cyclin domain-containing protein n=1 Tax=Thamnocephalis sphaerospora TaxID=78915 RepID=A0A4P9XLL5_9FUNG|nr:hypothetical protein THASP1DRAFT_31428 [Thamnocephalis sphaerospora]|eukprot:RKP06768.1 hypothetical protein THASP1DRAFT_31428 [Thamnocephalis sphaerospora]
MVQELIHVGNLELNMHSGRYEPDIRLLSLVIVLVRAYYGLDGRARSTDGLFPMLSLQDWLKQLDHHAASSQHIPWSFCDLEQFASKYPDKYMAYCDTAIFPRDKVFEESRRVTVRRAIETMMDILNSARAEATQQQAKRTTSLATATTGDKGSLGNTGDTNQTATFTATDDCIVVDASLCESQTGGTASQATSKAPPPSLEFLLDNPFTWDMSTWHPDYARVLGHAAELLGATVVEMNGALRETSVAIRQGACSLFADVAPIHADTEYASTTTDGSSTEDIDSDSNSDDDQSV